MSISTYKRIINGETKDISVYTVYLACKLCSISFCELIASDDLRKSCVRVSGQLSPASRRFVEMIADFECEFIKTTPNHEDYTTLMIPVGNLKDGMTWDSCSVEKINIAPYRELLKNDICCALEITSDHFRPAFIKGDILLLGNDSPVDGDVCIMLNKSTGKAHLRKYSKQDSIITLTPLNGQAAEIRIHLDDLDKWDLFGIVLTKMRT